MIRTAIVCPDSDLRERLGKTLADVRGLFITRQLSYYPDELELVRLVQASGPEMMFLSLEAPERALDLARLATSHSDSLEIVAIARQHNEQLLISMMKAGIRHVLTAPFDAGNVAKTVQEAAARIDEQRGASKGGAVYSFLPAKPGGGTSTLALNTCMALARAQEGLSLLMDFDFNLGVIGFLLGLPPGQAVFDAAAEASEPEEANWSRRVAAVEGVHVLPSGGMNPGLRIEITQLRHLIDFARRVYSHVTVDMSGNMEAFSVEILRESQRIVLVVSLDPLAAHLAAKRLTLLSRLDLADRVLLVATRATERDWMVVGQLERVLGRDVDLVVPHDRAAVRAAVEAREPVDPRSGTGKLCSELARMLVRPKRSRRLTTLKKAFLEHFSLSPSR